jgi:hypothetical protein
MIFLISFTLESLSKTSNLFEKTKLERAKSAAADDDDKKVIIYLADYVNIECPGVHDEGDSRCGFVKLGYVCQKTITSQHKSRLLHINPLGIIYWFVSFSSLFVI